MQHGRAAAVSPSNWVSAYSEKAYARVSTDDQNLDAQTDALTAAGAGKVFADKISGSNRERPELDRMLDQLRDGDVVTGTYPNQSFRTKLVQFILFRQGRSSVKKLLVSVRHCILFLMLGSGAEKE